MKVRIDKLLVEREFAGTLKEAQGLVMAGRVLAQDVPITKTGSLVDKNISIRIKGERLPYVSRGGLKLEAAIREFKIDVNDKVCLDVGASTGGFTDCLLQHGAKRVYAVDVGYGQMAPSIAADPRVIVIDRQNIRGLKKEKIPEPVDIVTIDVSFISLLVVFKHVDLFLEKGGSIIALIKPQFEADREMVGRKGIVTDTDVHQFVIGKVVEGAWRIHWSHHGIIDSPIKGAKGNKEFLALFKKS